jgi:hypothetical protein
MLLDRPVVVIDCPQLLVNARVNRDKVALLRGAADVADGSGAGEAVRRALAEPHRHSARRRTIADELFYGAGRAAGRAAACVYDALAMPQPTNILLCAPVMVPARLSPLDTGTT